MTNETLTNTPPDKPGGTYSLQAEATAETCNDGSAPEHPMLVSNGLALNNQAGQIARPVILTLPSGRMAELVNAATRYDEGSGTYLDRATYRVTDDSGDSITWLLAGQISATGQFAGEVHSWGSYRSRNIRCASSAAVSSES